MFPKSLMFLRDPKIKILKIEFKDEDCFSDEC